MEKDTSPDSGGYGDLGDASFVPGVDLVSPWREADEVAEELNAALAALGVDARFLRAVAHVGPRGEPVVWLRPESGRLIARRLRGAAAVPGARVVEFRRAADEREGELGHGAA
ncbi:hypothetical protein [Streptomyces caeruleatus]|uniref:hypothetical protein n=1 Tax=Streptomyces caeruleatus TaxID=661399 RepID=UPI001ABF460D|nr:hypothetical protein [Streptomyces caeruleatus]